jgi:hypothetical protein
LFKKFVPTTYSPWQGMLYVINFTVNSALQRSVVPHTSVSSTNNIYHYHIPSNLFYVTFHRNIDIGSHKTCGGLIQVYLI